MQQQRAVIAAEPVAPVIANSPLLSRPGCWFNDSRVRIETKIALPESQCRSGFRAGDLTTKQTARTINPAVETILETVDSRLKIMSRKAGQKFLNLVRFAITVGVFRIQHVRSRTDQ